MKKVLFVSAIIAAAFLCGCSKTTEISGLTVENAPSAPVCTPNLANETIGTTVATTKALKN